VHAELRTLADEWARRMAAAHDVFHSPLDTRVVGARWVRLGENVAVDISIVAAERALEASPGHLANLLSPSFDYVGIGVVHGDDGGVYLVQEFMQSAAAPQSPAPPAPRPAVRTAPIPAPARRAGRSTPSSSPRRAPPTPRLLPPPPPPAPPEPPQPSARLVDVFDRLRGLDARLTGPPRG
jgi:cysteine-rich secretory family protein